MALMPDDLMNQRFTPVRFSEGYDMDEVDNFLDNDVVPRLQELIDENGRLTKELEEAHNRIAELESAPSAAAASVEDDDVVEETTVSAEDADATAPQQVVEDSVTEEPVDEEPAAEQPATDAPQDAAGIIVLANRLHDEYVQKGEDERDRLITEANEERRRIVAEAEHNSRATQPALEEQKADLDSTIEGLRACERDCRTLLRDRRENLLRALDASVTHDKQVSFRR